MFLRITFLAAVFFAALSAGNAHAAQSCANTDWRALGYQDGDTRGTTADAHTYLVDRMADCEDGDAVDASAYNVGFLEGLASFCQPRRGFALARSGGVYSGFCPVELSETFATAFADGLRVRSVEQMASNARVLQRDQEFAERAERDRITAARVNAARNLVGSTRMMEAALSELVFLNGYRGPGDTARELEGSRRRAEQRAAAEGVRRSDLLRELETMRTEFGDRYGEW